MCKFSFVVPVYNVKDEYLEKCVNSILHNDFMDYEIIIVDDHSSNGCEILCDRFYEENDCVRVFHLSHNQGVSNARNYGITKSTGDWIVFVDSDDWVDSDICKKLSTYANEEEDIIVFSAIREGFNKSIPFGASPEVISYYKSSKTSDTNSTKDIYDNLLTQNLKRTHPKYDTVKLTCSKAFKREFILKNNLRFPDLNYCEDIVFMISAFRMADKVIQIPDRMYHYRYTSDSAVNSYRPNALSEQRKFLELVYQSIKDEHSDIIYYAALLSMQICITRFFYNKGNRTSLIRKHLDASKYFNSWPYSDVFDHVDYKNMKPIEKQKALFIKNKLYYLYYLGTEVRKIRFS